MHHVKNKSHEQPKVFHNNFFLHLFFISFYSYRVCEFKEANFMA